MFRLSMARINVVNTLEWINTEAGRYDRYLFGIDETCETLEKVIETLDLINANAVRIPKDCVADLLINTGKQLTLDL